MVELRVCFGLEAVALHGEFDGFSGVGQCVDDGVDSAFSTGEEEFVFVFEVAVDGSYGTREFCGDGANGGAVVAFFVEALDGGAEDLLARE